MEAMPRLTESGRRALDQIRLIAADASDAGLLARRALDAIDSAVPFDDGAVFGVDHGSRVFNRLLAYRGAEPEALREWVRDVYLVAREPGAMHFPTLLGRGGGVAVYHEEPERWLRAPPPPVPSRALREAWRQWESPAGGVARYGLAYRRKWIAALQLSRLEPGAGFRPAELELLERVAPTLARALAERMSTPARPDAGGHPPAGHLSFDERRRVVSVSESGAVWLASLSEGEAARSGPDAAAGVPVAVQALLSRLAGSDDRSARLTAAGADGRPVEVSAERAVRLDPERGQEVAAGYSVLVSAAPLSPDRLTGAQWAVAEAVARGFSDREIADSLQISPSTVHEHVAALHELLGTRTRPRLVAELAGALSARDR
jgi:DNA-binding CsgD family transcriptional regulator